MALCAYVCESVLNGRTLEGYADEDTEDSGSEGSVADSTSISISSEEDPAEETSAEEGPVFGRTFWIRDFASISNRSPSPVIQQRQPVSWHTPEPYAPREEGEDEVDAEVAALFEAETLRDDDVPMVDWSIVEVRLLTCVV